MIDYTKYSIPMLLGRNKNASYRQMIIESSVGLLSFLKREGLIKKEPFDKDGNLDLTFILKQSDLTLDGVELFGKAVSSWYNKIDKGINPSNVSYLEKELEKIREKKS